MTLPKTHLLAALLMGGMAFFSVSCGSGSLGSGPGASEVFETADEALQALVAVFQSEDPERLVAIYGRRGRDAIVTGDPVADRLFMRRMAGRFAERAELISVQSEEYAQEQWYKVRFGKEGWNMRIPLVNRGRGWFFSTEIAGELAKETRRELNEVTVVDTLLALMQAQAEYHQTDWDGDGVREYAGTIISTPSTRNGLYWPASPGDPQSPLHGVVVRAIEDGYEAERGTTDPVYEGYVYRILPSQGNRARGGAQSFLQNGNLTRGYALLAYPIRWGVSGSNTFAVGLDGKIMKKDLGIRTGKIGAEMKEINPDNTWAWIEHPDLGGGNSRLNW